MAQDQRSGDNTKRALQAVGQQVRAEEDPAEKGSSSEDLIEWLATQEALLRTYQGEWVAFVGHDVAAHAPSFLEVMRQVESLGVEEPFLVPVALDQPFIG
jgi:hypothetical protein